ncbi:hypothetical protein [Pseudomonas chlororaphis]
MSNNEMVSVPRELLERIAGLDSDYTVGQLDADEAELQSILAAPEPVWNPHPAEANLAALLILLAQSGVKVTGGIGDEPWSVEPAAQSQGEKPKGSGSLEFDKLLAEYHAIVWASAEDGDCDYDMAGVDVAKKLQAMFLAQGGQPQGEPVSRDSDKWSKDWKEQGFNYCIEPAIKALKYLADHPRPIGGESRYNAEHLIMTAQELALTRQELLIGRQPPAPVAVVLPERMEIPDVHCPERINAQGWNACLDEVARLNSL